MRHAYLLAFGVFLATQSAVCDELQDYIAEVAGYAKDIKIDGSIEDWQGIPSFRDSGEHRQIAPSMNITRMWMAPRPRSIAFAVETEEPPDSTVASLGFNIDFFGRSMRDIQLYLHRSGRHTLWIYAPGVETRKLEIQAVEVAVGDVVEVRLHYGELARIAETAPFLNLAQTGGDRHWIRATPYAFEHESSSVVDYGPAVASFVLRDKTYDVEDSAQLKGRGAVSLAVPFDKRAYISQGGHTRGTHEDAWAYDFVGTNRSLQESSPSNSSQVSDYYFWREPLYAPAAGTVLQAVGGNPDGPIGFDDELKSKANKVYVKVDERFAYRLSHLRQDTVDVERHDRVAVNDYLGEVGNSGYSHDPHLHLDAWRMPKGEQSLPIAFTKVRVSLNPVSNDPWYRDLDRWVLREGFFVEPLGE